MKSSFELAMERLGGAAKRLSDEQKRQIAEIDSVYKAKIAELKLRSEEKIKKSDNAEELEKVRKELSARISELEAKCEEEKEKARNA